MKKILAITTIRSDYDLMSGLYRLLHRDPDIDLQLLVAGAHLSPTFGRSVDQIRADGIPILIEIENLINADSPKSRLKTASVLLQNSIDIVAAWSPDLILYAGDREDVLVGGMLGTFLNIPTVHFFGGDHEKDGHADTPTRHATSKLSTFHVVSIEQHKQRLIKMGEPPSRIFVAGSIALDKFLQHSSAPDHHQKQLPPEKKLNGFAMLIYHPIDQTLENAAATFENILLSLKNAGIPAVISYPNSDPGNHAILEKITQYEQEPTFWFYKNLERDTFLSLFKQSRFLIGNSSAGILEAASIPLAAVNVGLRQRGRACGENVIFCDTTKEAVSSAIGTVITEDFQSSIAHMSNPYGDGNSCEKVYDLIKEKDFYSMIKKIEDPLEIG